MIAVITKTKKPEVIAQISKLIQANHGALSTQTSGYSVFDGKRTSNYIGSVAYEDYNIAKHVQYNGAPIWMTHFRISTGGDRGVDGLHLQNIGGYIFAHNGMVYGLKDITTKSDSYHFFNRIVQKAAKLKRPVAYDIISAAATKYGFKGKGFLYDTKRDIFHYFNNEPGYITLLEDTIILSSYKLENKLKTFKKNSILGYTWYTSEGEERIEYIYQKEIDNKYIKIDKKMVTDMDHINNYVGYQGQGYQSGYYHNKWGQQEHLPQLPQGMFDGPEDDIDDNPIPDVTKHMN